jgi:hypothetical protein
MATNENSTYIWELDRVYPDGATDRIFNGDDEIRQLKANIQDSFPNITGIVNATHTEINYLVGQSAPGDMFSANFSQVVRADATSVPTTNNLYNIGSGALRFATIYATTMDATTFSGQASSALYADLAEMYAADAEYSAGTVVMFGGTFEVTLADKATKKVAGVVSENPAYLMNAGLESTDGKVHTSIGNATSIETVHSHPVAIALMGRVPVKVNGKIEKGDLLIAGKNGHAIACPVEAYNLHIGEFIGKAIEDFNLEGKESPEGLPLEGVIEVLIGKV